MELELSAQGVPNKILDSREHWVVQGDCQVVILAESPFTKQYWASPQFLNAVPDGVFHDGEVVLGQ